MSAERDLQGLTCFVDTNVILYSLDSRDPRKQSAAAAWLSYLWREQTGRISWQVLNEFYVNAVRKFALPAAPARQVVELFSQWKPGGMSLEVAARGWHWMDQAQLTWWESLIVASAERQGCGAILSEDFSHGREYGSVMVINPFRSEPPA